MRDCERKRPTIGVLAGWQVYEGTIHSFLSSLFAGIYAAARDRGCNVLLACGLGGFPSDDTVVSPILPAWPVPSPQSSFVPVGVWNTDGLLVVTPLISQARSQDVRRFAREGHPVLFVGAGEEGATVTVDNEGGIRQALDHLIGHGHSRIAFISGYQGDHESDGLFREQAYRKTIRERGLVDDPDLVVCGYHTHGGGRQAMRQLLDRGIECTAVLASNDESAFGAMQALDEAGLRVSEDVAVIGFDDRLEAAARTPGLTTVCYPSFRVGYEALELLLRRVVRHKDIPALTRVPVRLVIRESCGCLTGTVTLVPHEEAERKGCCPRAGARRQRFVQAMVDAVSGETRRLPLEEVQSLCKRLVDACDEGLRRADGSVFCLAVQHVLQRVEAVSDRAIAWQGAIAVLKDRSKLLLGSRPHAGTRELLEDMLHRARVMVNASTRRQFSRFAVRRSIVDDRMAWMTARFLTASSMSQILEALAEFLPVIYVKRADVFFLEPEEDDPVAWSVLARSSEESARRFPSREFPAEGLYPEEEPFRLALLPLAIHGENWGYVAFDTENLGLCAMVARELASTIRSVQLYQEAIEARRLAEEGRRLAEEANHLKSRFLSMVSHELRTPLNLVVGLSGMLLEEQQEEKSLPRQYCEDLQRIYASAQHLDGLVRDVLDLARSDMGRLKLVCEPLELGEVIKAVMAVGAQMTRDKGLRWRAEVPESLPRVWADRTRLRQVILNLVHNAVKFTARGEVALTVELDGAMVKVSIRDTGLGIPPDEQSVIFDEFRQSERTTARGYGGLGLGLAICKKLIEMHGGRIWVESSGEIGGGSTFAFALPSMKETMLSDGQDLLLRREGTVLVLGERSSSGGRLRMHLKQQGFEVEELWIDERPGWLSEVFVAPPGAVVLDFPASKRGWEVLRVLKENPATRQVPVLFYSLKEDIDSGAVLEVDYLTKPVGTTELAQALERQGLIDEADQDSKTILVVDDEPGVLEMHARVVRAHLPACRVLKARNGREALAVIRRDVPDLVLLDLMMPELDGFGVLEAIHEEETTREVPIIVLTGQVLTEEDMARLNRGVTAVLGKGLFSVQETLTRMEAVLMRRQGLGSEARRVARQAMAYLHEHYSEPFSRADVAGHIGVSKGYLSRCFGEEIGLSPVAYLNRYRVRMAKALLAEGDRSVTEVAMVVGFSSVAHFSRLFRREVGIPPSAYQRRHRNR